MDCYLASGKAEFFDASPWLGSAQVAAPAAAWAHPFPLAKNFEESSIPKLALMIVTPHIE